MDLSLIEYVTLQGEQNDCPITYRCIKEPKHLKELFSHRISIIWPYESIGNGLASEEVNALQNDFEDDELELDADDSPVL